MALLPEELAAANEWSGMLELPTDYVSPLVELQWEISVAADPLGVVLVHHLQRPWQANG